MTQRTPEKVIPFAPTPRDQRQGDGDPLDRSGLAIVSMLQEAVDVAKQNSDRAMDIAHKLSLKLREAEDRIAQLEGDCRHYQERATRAEKWMHRIYSEIEDRFFKSAANGQAQNGNAQNAHAQNGHGGNGHAGNGHAGNGYANGHGNGNGYATVPRA